MRLTLCILIAAFMIAVRYLFTLREKPDPLGLTAKQDFAEIAYEIEDCTSLMQLPYLNARVSGYATAWGNGQGTRTLEYLLKLKRLQLVDETILKTVV